MLGELIPRGGGDPIPLLQPKLVVGRRSTCDIVLTFPNISSEHCEFQFLNGYWQVRDLNSRNGVKVNGERVDIKFLHPGDEVSIAKNHFEIQYEPLAEAPPPEESDPFALGLLEKAGLQKKQQEERERRRDDRDLPPLPPAAKGAPMPKEFDAEEDAAMDWLMGDS
jgi:adenylate cyclase